MKPNRHSSFLFLAQAILVLLSGLGTVYSQDPPQDDPVPAFEISIAPAIDGKGDDVCWQGVSWQPINQVWIPYGATVAADDYSGQYKVAWSPASNLLYFLVEVTDDVFVDGYRPGVTTDIYNFDIIEIFIDEDKSGGLHVFDGAGSFGNQFGTNAENAFAYHIYADFPEIEKVTTTCYVGDLAGTSWSEARSTDYASHFPEFALRKAGNKAIWELSLIVYNDTYQETNSEAARVQLSVDKLMGVSLAYCDNDDPAEIQKSRDSFYGSVRVPATAYNDHWKNADYFGTIKLVSSDTSAVSHK
jgi:hypothetical protein